MASSKGRGSLEASPLEWNGGRPAGEAQLKLQSQQENLEQLKTELASQKVGRCEGFGYLLWWGRTRWRLDRRLIRSPVIRALFPSLSLPSSFASRARGAGKPFLWGGRGSFSIAFGPPG